CPDDGKDPETLIQHAEVAMYTAKEKKTGHAFYNPQLNPHTIRRLTLLGELKQAIYNNQLELHYQPKLNLRSGKVEDAEALVRWKHPRLGMISPAEFIPIAEQSGLIKILTMWAIDRALSDRDSWSKDGINIAVAVNISIHNLHDDNFPDQIAGLLAKWHVFPSVLEMEITESLMMENPERTLNILKKINDLGIPLSLDDFGTGFSSLAYLKRLPVSQLKIDKSFVSDMETNENDRMIVKSIIGLSHDLNFKVVAEGVENESEIQLLREMGCDIVQGYHVSKPVPPDQLRQWLKNSPR
ncbi:MAG: GGDEF domain-containing phosphodiesterase, partial [Nitrospirota bacterium]|nr:GGDEF domain-containing phosphodiesterase [Nitrospirota bacterium]